MFGSGLSKHRLIQRIYKYRMPAEATLQREFLSPDVMSPTGDVLREYCEVIGHHLHTSYHYPPFPVPGDLELSWIGSGARNIR